MTCEQRGQDQPGENEVGIEGREERSHALWISTRCPLMGKQRPAGKLKSRENETTCHVGVDKCRPDREALKRCKAVLRTREKAC